MRGASAHRRSSRASGIRIRPAVAGDARPLALLDYDTWTQRRRRPVLEPADVGFFDRSHGGGIDDVLVATLPDAIAGFAVVVGAEELSGDLVASLTAIAVDPFRRRRRVGTALLIAATMHAEKVGLGALHLSAPRENRAVAQLLAATGFHRDRRSELDAAVVAEETRWVLTADQARTARHARLRT